MKHCLPLLLHNPQRAQPTGHTKQVSNSQQGKEPNSAFPEKHTEGQKDAVNNKIQWFIEQNGARQCSLYIQRIQEYEAKHAIHTQTRYFG